MLDPDKCLISRRQRSGQLHILLVQKSKDVEFTGIFNREKQQIQTLRELEPKILNVLSTNQFQHQKT